MGELSRVIVGQEEIVKRLIACLFANGHCLLIGVPGLAKTLLVQSIADVLGVTFKRIQFTPDLMPSDIIGSEVVHETIDLGLGHPRSGLVEHGGPFGVRLDHDETHPRAGLDGGVVVDDAVGHDHLAQSLTHMATEEAVGRHLLAEANGGTGDVETLATRHHGDLGSAIDDAQSQPGPRAHPVHGRVGSHDANHAGTVPAGRSRR